MEENEFENVVWKMAAIMSRLRYVNHNTRALSLLIRHANSI